MSVSRNTGNLRIIPHNTRDVQNKTGSRELRNLKGLIDITPFFLLGLHTFLSRDRDRSRLLSLGDLNRASGYPTP